MARHTTLDAGHGESFFARRCFRPGCHRIEPYRSRLPNPESRLPVTEMLADRVLVLPTGTAVGAGEVSGICEIIRLLVEHGAEIRERLDGHTSRAAAPLQ